jgi:hypothetical protein
LQVAFVQFYLVLQVIAARGAFRDFSPEGFVSEAEVAPGFFGSFLLLPGFLFGFAGALGGRFLLFEVCADLLNELVQFFANAGPGTIPAQPGSHALNPAIVAAGQ